ncbi:MAG: FkbM family methyltransferase [Alphaproteobacteria bacterium]|nr:FkbM family methyltransferase [Alphaproteobacteria bacterium]
MTDSETKKKRSVIQSEEIEIISKCIQDGDVVFDVGAFHGEWSDRVRRSVRNCSLHLFEASPDAHRTLSAGPLSREIINHVAVSDQAGNLVFHVYRDKPMLSTIYRRLSVEEQILPSGFDAYNIPSIRLDEYWPAENGLINFLKIDVEGAEYDVLRGANELLRRGAVDYIQFEYGGTFEDSGTTLKSVFFYLKRHGYHLFKVEGQSFQHIADFSVQLEDYRYANYLAVNERHLSRFKQEKPKISIYFDELDSLGIAITGVVHIGAHQGLETTDYLSRGLDPIALIEANPKHARELSRKYGGSDRVFISENAISDQPGEVAFNIASSDQSSSLLNLGVHAKLYPGITYSDQIKVQAQTLDQCLADLLPDPADRSRVNLLIMDIQGAELMALRGGVGTLANVEAIQLEVNFEELYAGCPSIWDLDSFLAQHGFVRYKTDTPFHRSWGDALYVRKPLIANSTIGSLGRFGNHFFQYLFLKYHAMDMGYSFEHTPWVGDQMFNTSPGVAVISKNLREVKQTDYSTETCQILNGEDRLANTNLTGFFQYNTLHYKRHRESIQSTFSFKGPYLDRARQIKAAFEARGEPVIGLHLRRGDYGNRWFFIAPTRWYIDWLRSLQASNPRMTIFIASDDLDLVIPDFSEFNVMTSRDLPTSGPADPDFFDDFAALTLCDKLAISNSSFSFAASLLNTRADDFVRPDLSVKSLVGFDPWRAEPLLRGELAEEHGAEFVKPTKQ